MRSNLFYRSGHAVNMMCRNGRIIYQNVKSMHYPSDTVGWVLLSSIDNTVPFDAIAWKQGYSIPTLDGWVSQISGVSSDNMSLENGDETYGWFGAHRWNGSQYSCTFVQEQFEEMQYSPDPPEVEYGISVLNKDVTSLPLSSITISGQSVQANVLEFKDFTG